MSAMKVGRLGHGRLSVFSILCWRQFRATGDTVMVMIYFFPGLNGYK